MVHRLLKRIKLLLQTSKAENIKVSLLGSDADVEIMNDNGKLSLKANIDSPDDIKSSHLYTYKISF